MTGSTAVAAGSLIDNAGIGTPATGESGTHRAQLADRPSEGDGQPTATKQNDLMEAAPDGVLGQAEGDPVGVPLGDAERRLVDKLAADGVEQAMGPKLLTDADLGLRAERAPGALSNLEFVSQDLDLPALAVELGQLQRVGRERVEQIGEQAVDLPRALEPVLDDPDRERVTLAESDQIAAVAEVAEAALADALFGPPEEVDTGLGKVFQSGLEGKPRSASRSMPGPRELTRLRAREFSP